jgi:hypothetical protein
MASQDKVYFLDGRCVNCKVLEISEDELLINKEGEEQKLNREELLLILYKNGTTESLNIPKQSSVYHPTTDKRRIQEKELFKPHYISLNTAALCNADVSVFYEHLTRTRLFGFGVMGAYNFNAQASFQNIFIVTLPNAKKNYDLGATFNFYPGKFESRTGVTFGMMMKYTHITFDAQTIVNSPNGNIVEYRRAQGSQLATIFTMGTHTSFKNNVFIRTLFGLGGFKLKGDYKSEYNKIYFGNSLSFLPKIYIGFNVGFNI